MSYRLTIRNLNYVVRDHVLLRDISLVCSADHCTALLGANGAGKTTLLRLCHGLIEPSRGAIRWGEQKPAALGRRIAMVFQKPCLLRRSAQANVDYALRLHGFSSAERRHRIEEVFSRVSLEHRSKHQAQLLSGGEQQRLAIARACALSPHVILMDEPTAKLDMESTAMVEAIILKLKRDGVKIMFTSHNPAQARRLCDDVIFLDRGYLITHTSHEKFFNNTENEMVCDFMRLQSLV